VVNEVTMNKELQTADFGKIRPSGWIKDQMQRDLDGFVGHLDQLAPGLIIDDKIYGEHRLTGAIRRKNVGNIQADDEWVAQYLWWNSESQSNWWDGYLRHAFMLNDKNHLKRAAQFIEYILSTQDEDGYIGIYAPDLRYKFSGENGELWSKATLYRVLLAYYEATKEKKVLDAVIRAVQNVMDEYPIHSSTPFLAQNSYSGISHGLMFTDVLDKLFRVTGKKVYTDYAVFLFQDYCRQDVFEKDVQLRNILDESYQHIGHGVHTYEHIRSLALAAFSSGDPELQEALTIYLKRINLSMTPSGGPIGDEWIFQRQAHASDTGYEYCSIQELMHSFLFILQKTNDPGFADKAERIFFNAAQGARHPEHSSIAYLKTDNSFEMCGTRNGEAEPDKQQTRYKYSPVHQDIAVCCSPNAGRISPYFVQNMWMKDEEGLIACLFGPCAAEMSFDTKKVGIKETTGYPYDFTINFEISCNEPVAFVLKIRRPQWTKTVKVNVSFDESEGFICIRKNWKGIEGITVIFEPELQVHPTFHNDIYFSYGPLVLAHPIDAVETRTKEYGVKGMCDTHYRPVDLTEYAFGGGDIKKKDERLWFEAELVNMKTKKQEKVTLVPVGKTILRQVSFERFPTLP
jgi:uncharacterized protein